MNIDELIAHSGDSKLKKYHYDNENLSITIEIDDLNLDVKMKIPTNKLSIDMLQKNDDILKTCYIEISLIKDFLDVKNGIYTPSNDFGKMMREVKLDLNLAYGLRETEFKYILSLVGYSRLISCIVADKLDIKYSYIELNGI